MKPSVRRGFWVSIDGVEGTGKTTLAGGLASHYGAILVPEFSDSLTGRALREAVTNSPHLINESRIGQSLTFIGDFHETYEAHVLPGLDAAQVVVSDRGWLSKYAYQSQVLEEVLSAEEANTVLLRILALPRMPDLTIHLTCDMPIVRDRLIARDGACDEVRERFIVEAATKYIDISAQLINHPAVQHPIITIDTSTHERVLDEAIAALDARGINADESR